MSKSGNDASIGSESSPFKTISAATRIAQPGDAITVHEGVYLNDHWLTEAANLEDTLKPIGEADSSHLSIQVRVRSY